MENSKLDRMVAEKVMGWHIESGCYPHSEERFDNWVDDKGVGRYSVSRPTDQWLPSELISQAMEVVGKLKNCDFVLKNSKSYPPEEPWCAWFENFVTGTKDWAGANTPQRAICLAALATVENKAYTKKNIFSFFFSPTDIEGIK